MLEPLADAIGVLLRRHVIASMRPVLASEGAADHGSADLAAGFVDLVGYTALGQELSIGELARLLTRFEDLCHEVIATHAGRLVKMIGDEVMFVAHEASTACLIATDIVLGLNARELPPARGGVDFGEVLTRGGDYFGPVVNLASRLASLAEPGSILVSQRARSAAEMQGTSAASFSSVAPRQVRGIGAAVQASALLLATNR